MHADDVGKYDGPPCEVCRTSQFVGTCTHRPRRYRAFDGTLNGEPASGIVSREYEQMAWQKFQLEMQQKAHDYDDVAFFLSTRPVGEGEAVGMNAAVRHLRQEAQKMRYEAQVVVDKAPGR